jgi:hypothetical protein
VAPSRLSFFYKVSPPWVPLPGVIHEVRREEETGTGIRARRDSLIRKKEQESEFEMEGYGEKRKKQESEFEPGGIR